MAKPPAQIQPKYPSNVHFEIVTAESSDWHGVDAARKEFFAFLRDNKIPVQKKPIQLTEGDARHVEQWFATVASPEQYDLLRTFLKSNKLSNNGEIRHVWENIEEKYILKFSDQVSDPAKRRFTQKRHRD